MREKIVSDSIYFFTYHIFTLSCSFSEDTCTAIKFCTPSLSHKNKLLPDFAKNLHDYFYSYFSGKESAFTIIFKHKKDEIIALNNESSKAVVLDLSPYTDNEIKVYLELIKTKMGEKISYGELARRCGFYNAARFIGNTMAKNNFPIIIPCHRVIKNNGSIGNYTGGSEIKRTLLSMEEKFSF